MTLTKSEWTRMMEEAGEVRKRSIDEIVIEEGDLIPALLPSNRIGNVVVYVDDNNEHVKQGTEVLRIGGRTVSSAYNFIPSSPPVMIDAPAYWRNIFNRIQQDHPLKSVTVLLDLNLRDRNCSGYDVLELLAEGTYPTLKSVIVITVMEGDIKGANTRLDFSPAPLPVYAAVKDVQDYRAGLVRTLNEIEKGKLLPRNQSK